MRGLGSSPGECIASEFNAICTLANLVLDAEIIVLDKNYHCLRHDMCLPKTISIIPTEGSSLPHGVPRRVSNHIKASARIWPGLAASVMGWDFDMSPPRSRASLLILVLGAKGPHPLICIARLEFRKEAGGGRLGASPVFFKH